MPTSGRFHVMSELAKQSYFKGLYEWHEGELHYFNGREWWVVEPKFSDNMLFIFSTKEQNATPT